MTGLKKIMLSLGMVVVVGAVVASGTGAFFSDTETSTGNTFTAGSLDLKVDSEAHYNGSICLPLDDTNPNTPPYTWQGGNGYPVGLGCDGSWAETDLGVTHQFFDLNDVKPGDEGENTISLHVYNNDAWGKFVISNVKDFDNTCTEPEEGSADTCTVNAPELETPGAGELREAVVFSAFIDDGSMPGFQGKNNDAGEGDNIKNHNEQTIILPGTVDESSETHDLWTALTLYRTFLGSACATTDSDGNGQTGTAGNPATYQVCQGIATDGRLVGSTTYYFGLEWNVPNTVGNEVQTDSLAADLGFQVVQHRNNPGHAF